MRRWGTVAACALLAAVAVGSAPAHAQQREERSPIEQLLDGVKQLLDRVFRPEPRAPAPVEERPVAAPQPVAVAPAAQPSSGLHEAIARGDDAAALKLIDEGADINEKDPGAGASPLHYAVMKGRLPMIKLLIARGADVGSRTRTGTTPLHTAVLYSRLEAARLLIDAGADVNAQSATGTTPLKLAEAANNAKMAELLRSRGAK